jgi:hypothetical protein
MTKPEDLTLDQLLYNAVLYLVQREKQEAAELLVDCELDGYEDKEALESTLHSSEPRLVRWTQVTLSAPTGIEQAISDNPDTVWDAELETEFSTNLKRVEMASAFEAVLRREDVLVEVHLQLVTETEADWRQHLRQLIKGEKVTNQGQPIKSSNPIIVWNNLNFRSKAEKLMAEALDRAGVMYLPDCMARLGPADYRHNMEPDFLICCEGKWGILEVDSNVYHQQPERDHEKGRQYKQQGIKVFERYSYSRCLEKPDETVQDFLRLLRQNG